MFVSPYDTPIAKKKPKQQTPQKTQAKKIPQNPTKETQKKANTKQRQKGTFVFYYYRRWAGGEAILLAVDERGP